MGYFADRLLCNTYDSDHICNDQKHPYLSSCALCYLVITEIHAAAVARWRIGRSNSTEARVLIRCRFLAVEPADARDLAKLGMVRMETGRRGLGHAVAAPLHCCYYRPAAKKVVIRHGARRKTKS